MNPPRMFRRFRQNSKRAQGKQDEEEKEILYKIVLLGDSGVGKSNILLQHIRGQFLVDSKPTIGVEFMSKVVQVDNNELVKTQIWDTAGQERYQMIAGSYYRRAEGAVIVYDVTNEKTFEHVPKWMKAVEENAPEGCVFVLMGNKRDREDKREVSYRDGFEFAQANGIQFCETSAKDSTNISQAFQQLTQTIHDIHQKKKENENNQEKEEKRNTIVLTIKDDNTKMKQCCNSA